MSRTLSNKWELSSKLVKALDGMAIDEFLEDSAMSWSDEPGLLDAMKVLETSEFTRGLPAQEER